MNISLFKYVQIPALVNFIRETRQAVITEGNTEVIRFVLRDQIKLLKETLLTVKDFPDVPMVEDEKVLSICNLISENYGLLRSAGARK